MRESTYDTSHEFERLLGWHGLTRSQIHNTLSQGLRDDNDAQHERLTDHFNHHIGNAYEAGHLTEEQNDHLGGILDYTSSSRAINLRLQGHSFDSEDTNSRVDESIRHIRGAFEMAPPSTEIIHSYAGLTPKKVARHTGFSVGQTASFPALSSTSIHVAQALGFVGNASVGTGLITSHFAHFITPMGSRRGMYVDPISTNKGEREWLLGPGTRATFLGSRQIGSDHHVIHVHSFQVHDD